jgi:hypothetical protein
LQFCWGGMGRFGLHKGPPVPARAKWRIGGELGWVRSYATTTEKLSLPCSLSLLCVLAAKIYLPCARRKTHGKDLGHDKDRHKSTTKIGFTATTEEAAQQRNVQGNAQHTARQRFSARQRRWALSCLTLCRARNCVAR